MVTKLIILVLAGLILLGGFAVLYHGITYEYKTELPPGYSFVCNGKGKYKWETSSRVQSYGGSKQSVIDSAWLHYKEGDYSPNNCD